MPAANARDYYEQLFSPDSDTLSPFATAHEDDHYDFTDLLVHTPAAKPQSSQRFLFDADWKNVINVEKTLAELEDAELDEIESANSESIDCDSSVTSYDSLEFLEEDEMERLLKDDSKEYIDYKNVPFKSDKCSKSNPFKPAESHVDIIGTFNIQNKYDHALACQLFLEGDFTFLSVQEPFASTISTQDTWSACRRLELQSARITCYETHHQVIMFDSWRWGGKVLDSFDSKLNGRVTSIAFQFDNDQKIGIISVYALANGGMDAESDSKKHDLRKSIVYSISKKSRQWKKKYPNMDIMILGDFQETCTTTDFDNVGKSRYKIQEETSILQAMSDSHTSIVRDRMPAKVDYITRYGTEGGRGIDHILFPSHIKAQSMIVNAQIDNDLGSFYFPSDHRLLKCSIRRQGSNNAECGESKTKYAFKSIFSIKVKRGGPAGKTLTLDESQFKGSKNFRLQRELFNKVQDLTANSSPATDFHLTKIERSIRLLYKSLWKAGLEQKVCGVNNKLVEINDRQAAELSAITETFDLAIKDSMNFLELTTDEDCLGRMASTRWNLKLKKGFKLFSNLPTSTKLRYLRSWIKQKKRRVKKILKDFQADDIHTKWERQPEKNVSSLEKNWGKTLHSDSLVLKASEAYKAILEEATERGEHIDAILSKQHNPSAKNEAISKANQLIQEGNHLKHLPENTVNLINEWLARSKCTQSFNRQNDTDTFNVLKSVSSWSQEIKDIDIKKLIWTDEAAVTEFREKIGKTLGNLNSLESKIGRAQMHYRLNTIEYLLHVNKIGDFTRMVKPKARDAPAVHTEIWDPETKRFRPCRNEREEILATGEFHGHWMDNSAAKEMCAFAKLRKVGKLGARGVSLMPDRKITVKDVPKLVANANKMSKKDKVAFVKAHGEHTASLFRAPSQSHKELFYPFFQQNEDGILNKEVELSESFWKSISSVPGKARFDGFQMAVVGRMGERWQQCLYDITKLILLMRYVPKQFKTIARFPIPKPGKVNEYRPISLCHDVYCYVNAISTKYSSQGILDAKILHEGITAYVKGKGCTTLVAVEQAIREDCIESKVPTSQTDEDEEKFFDRIPVEVLLAAMRVNGFPQQGYVELKASGMGPKAVEIITAKGTAFARFVCGLEQGNPDSPTIANLVIKFKHDIWHKIIKSIRKVTGSKTESDQEKNNLKERSSIEASKSVGVNGDAYNFHITDAKDGKVKVDRIGYCDDNTRYTSSMNEKDVILATEYFLQQAGDLSLVTKIGRKGSKSEVHYFNLRAETAIKIRKINSFAWSFANDSPKHEKVPFKIYLQPDELSKAFKLAKFESMDSVQQVEFLQIFKPVAHKHLGLRSTLAGNTESASTEVLNKIKKRLATLKLANMDNMAQRLCANMLCSSVHSYAPLQMLHDVEELLKCDDILVQYLCKRKGLSKSDAKNAIFIDEKNGGHGIRSFLEVDLIANAREMEIVLNGHMIDSRATRARLAAYVIRHDNPLEEQTHNFIGASVSKLAKYGVHIRDKNDDVINYVLGEFQRKQKYTTVGNLRYKDKNSYSIGKGFERNLDLAYGGNLHAFLRRAISNTSEVKERVTLPIHLQHLTTLQEIKTLVRKFRDTRFTEFASTFNCWEWCATHEAHPISLPAKTKTISNNAKDWKYINVTEELRNKYPFSYWRLSEDDIFAEAQIILDIRNRHKELFTLIHNHLAPIFIATDGSHHPTTPVKSHLTTSAAVLCLADIRDGEQLEDSRWTERTALPIVARSARLTSSYGANKSDIAHGECQAMCMGVEMFSEQIPKVIISDSKSVREVFLSLRDKQNEDKDRPYIRSIISGVSKHLCGRLERSIRPQIMKTDLRYTKTPASPTKLQSFIEISAKWCNESIDPRNGKDEDTVHKNWNVHYHDRHDTNVCIKVDSHQLNDEGTDLKTPRRYPNLSPNKCMLSCNHFADKCAEITTRTSFQNSHDLHNFTLPVSALRFFFSCDGTSVDKHISEFLHVRFQDQKIKQIKTKKTQGLPWRICPNTNISWQLLRKNKGLCRSLSGLTRTHTRSLYKSSTYRQGLIEEAKSNPSFQSNIQPKMSKGEWIKLLAPCSWCVNPNNTKGNRWHALHFCANDKLLSFRDDMYSLLESKLKLLLETVTKDQNKFSARLFLQDVENTLIKLHNLKGRESDHISYRTRHVWMREENISSHKDLMDGTLPILCHIFGFMPVMEAPLESDMNINTAMAITLGVIPRLLDKCIEKISKGIEKFFPDKNICQAKQTLYQKLWDQIKEINLARVIGLHRIIGGISSDEEKRLRDKYNIPNAFSKRPIKKLLKSNPVHDLTKSILKQSSYTQSKRGRDIQSESHLQQPTRTKRRKIKFEQANIPPKRCNGITCDSEHGKWSFHSKAPNMIDAKTKHCQRCSRQLTALKKGTKTLTICRETKDTTLTNNLVNYLDDTVNSINHSATTTILQKFSPNKDMPQMESKKRKRCSDAQKLLVQMISTSIAKSTTRGTDATERLETAIELMESTAKKVGTFLKNDSVTNLSIDKEFGKKESYNQKKIKISGSKSSGIPDSVETILLSNKDSRKNNKNAIEIRRRRHLLTTDQMHLAVMNIRYKAPDSVFIGSAAISSSLRRHMGDDIWKSIASQFGSEKVFHSKPNGIYILPIFEGEALNGHWFFAVIEKGKKWCKGWIVDSLGRGSTNTDIAKRIKSAFSKARLSCCWQPIRTVTQRESECGPRAISGMVSICEAIRNGASTQTAVNTLMSTDSAIANYDPQVIRRIAAETVVVDDVTMQAMNERRDRLRRVVRIWRRQHQGAQVTNNEATAQTEFIDLCGDTKYR